jgi:hypothetical protein
MISYLYVQHLLDWPRERPKSRPDLSNRLDSRAATGRMQRIVVSRDEYPLLNACDGNAVTYAQEERRKEREDLELFLSQPSSRQRDEIHPSDVVSKDCAESEHPRRPGVRSWLEGGGDHVDKEGSIHRLDDVDGEVAGRRSSAGACQRYAVMLT